MTEIYRPIRFRAWNSALKQMMDYRQLFEHYISPEGKGLLWKGAVQTGLVPMQSTGQTDDNGQEIYEGDIVFAPINECHYVVKYGLYENTGEDYSEMHLGFYISGVIWGRVSEEALGDGKFLKVIGNIYENPGLLVGEQG